MRRTAVMIGLAFLVPGGLAGQDTATDPVDSLAAAFAEAWTLHDAEMLSATLAPDAEYHATPPGTVYTGPEAVGQYLIGTFAGSPESEFVATRTIRQGNMVAMEWVWSGTNTAAWEGMPLTGKAFSVSGVSVLEIEDGKIQQVRDYWDRMAFLEQLGLVPPPEG